MHKNSQKRIYGDYIYFITCDVFDKIEFFKEELFCNLWVEEMKLCKELKKFQLFAFCLNYDHFHIMTKPVNKIANYSQIMHFLKRNFSQNVNKMMGYTQFKPTIFEADIEKCHIRENCVPASDDAHRRLREFDEITKKYRLQYVSQFGDRYHPKFKWQKSFHDHVIRDERDFENHWNYTMNNYVKHDLPENWQYTGLNYPEMIDEI